MSTEQTKLNALIIGAGKIGSDFDDLESQSVLTHAKAYETHPGFNLIGLVENNKDVAKKASDKWKKPTFVSIEESLENFKVDVVSLCVPDNLHFDFLEKIKKFNIKNGILEKPLVVSKEELEKVSENNYFSENNFVVNYSRRFVPEFVKIREDIIAGKYGEFEVGNCWYGKGFVHNSSHIINLLLFFGLEIQESKALSHITDYSEEDPSYSVLFTTAKNKNITLNVMDSRKYKVFEIDLFFEKGRIRISNDGFDVEIFIVKDDDVFSGYKKLFCEENIKTELNKSLYNAVDNIYNLINNRADNLSDVASAIKTQDIIFNLNK
ncbi:Gfo/Idh/MocA family oxidoreductase [Candidatus Nomurabacteria bacterium]|nr:Gfo/Idh/MocA family oxidoreductase [Candidatus Nomurabacteria bacterium]